MHEYLAAHVVMSMYGFWLPNDPRGSWSTYVGNRRLLAFGPATKVETHRSVAGRPHDRSARLAAKQSLTFPPVRLTGVQARAIIRSFGGAVRDGGYVVHACAILPDHAHLVIVRHARRMSVIAGHLKAQATRTLRQLELWPRERPVWGRRSWGVFLDAPADVRRAIRYVENNPRESGPATAALVIRDPPL